MPEYLIDISLQEGVSVRIKAKDKEDALAQGERLASYWGGTNYDEDEIVIESEHVHRDWSVDFDREIERRG